MIPHHDHFGLEKERKIKSAGVREIFTPHTPITSHNSLAGRETEVARLIEYLNTPGQHALLYGERGVGKSSLANVAANLFISQGLAGSLLTKKCDTEDNFISIMSIPLSAVGIDVSTLEFEARSDGGIGGALMVTPTFGKGKTVKKQGHAINANSASWVADKLKELDAVFMVDEFDVISEECKRKIAELLKHLSDSNSKLKILIVGIAETAQELTAGHPSVQRCLKELHIARMQPVELKEIIASGERRLRLTFSQEAVSRIINVSSGYPHFTHLLALKAAEDAIIDDRETIGVEEIGYATDRAVEDSEGTLKRIYDDAIRSANSDEYRKILLAAALCNPEEFKASELKKKYADVFSGEQLQSGILSNHLGKLVGNDHSLILRRISKGVYKFTDPRMPSYIRIAQSYLI